MNEITDSVEQVVYPRRRLGHVVGEHVVGVAADVSEAVLAAEHRVPAVGQDVEEELLYLFDNSQARASIYHAICSTGWTTRAIAAPRWQ